MKTLKYLALAAVAMLAACNNDNAPQLTGTFEAQVSAENYGTRTALGADNSLSWTNNDVLGIYVDGVQQNCPFKRKGSNFMGSFAYTGKSEAAATFRAYYPYSANAQGYTITACLPSTQNAAFDGSADFMVSTPLTSTYSEAGNMKDINMVFDSQSHLFTILRLTLTDGAEKSLATETISSIKISSEGNILSGTFRVDISQEECKADFVEGQDFVTLSFDSRPSLAQPITAYAVVRPTEQNKPIALTVDINTTGGKATFISPAIELKASTVKELPTIVVSDNWAKTESYNEAFSDPALLQIILKEGDTDNNGKLSPEELSAITTLSVAGSKVQSLNGIELLTNLKSFDCSSTNIVDLNLEDCPKLTTLTINNTSFGKLDLSKNTALQTLSGQGMQCIKLDLSNNKAITSVNLSGCSIETLTLNGLEKLTEFTPGQIVNLSAQGCKGLTALSVINIGLRSLDLTNCRSLTSLECYDNAELATLKLNGCTALTSIMCRQCAFTELDLSGLSALTSILCQRNSLSSINLKGCTSLNNFYAHTNKWVELDLSMCTALGTVNVKDSPTLKKVILPAGKNASIVNSEGTSAQIQIGK